MAKAFPGPPVPTALERIHSRPNHSRSAKFEAHFLDRETEAQRGEGTDLEAPAARKAARARRASLRGAGPAAALPRRAEG